MTLLHKDLEGRLKELNKYILKVENDEWTFSADIWPALTHLIEAYTEDMVVAAKQDDGFSTYTQTSPPNQDTEVDEVIEQAMVNAFKLGMLDALGGAAKPNPMPALKEQGRNIKSALNLYYKSVMLEAVEGAEIDSNFSSHAQNGFVMAKSVIRERLESRLGSGPDS